MRPHLSVVLPGLIAAAIALLSSLVLPGAAAAISNDGRPKILLHVRPVTSKNRCSQGALPDCRSATTEGGIANPGTGPFQFVYVLAARGAGPPLAGLQFGIDFQGLDIFGWQQCASLEAPSMGAHSWPRSGSGNTIIWDAIDFCQSGDASVAGYFYVGAYSPDSLRVTVRPDEGQATIVNCSSEETIIYGPDLGIVVFSNTATSGCNPCDHDCPDFGVPRPSGPPGPPPPPPPTTPRLGVIPGSLQFSFQTPSRPPATLTVSNVGGGELLVQAIPALAWVNVTPASHDVPGGQSRIFSVAITPGSLPAGQYSTTITLASNDSLDPSHPVAVTLDLGSPALHLSWGESVHAAVHTGYSTTAGTFIFNTGATPLNWSVTDTAPWLSADPALGTLVAGRGAYITLMIQAAELAEGEYVDTLRIESNDPAGPNTLVRVHLSVRDFLITADRETVDFVVPWHGGLETAFVQFQDHSRLLADMAADPSAEWLSVFPVEIDFDGGFGEMRFSIDASRFPVGHFETVVPFRTLEEVFVHVRVDVLPTPPKLTLDPAIIVFDSAENGGARVGTIRIGNSGYEPLDFNISESSLWLSMTETSGMLGPGGNQFLALSIDPSDLLPGTYDETLEIDSNDPVLTHLSVPIRLIVRPAPPRIDEGALVVNEFSTGCDNASAPASFIELRSIAPGSTYRSTLGLSIEDGAGVIRYQATGIVGEAFDGTPWPVGENWLLVAPGYLDAGSLTPDRVLPFDLDPVGGVVTIFDGDPVDRVLQRLPYGTRGSLVAPAPGQSLERLLNGNYTQSGVPSPMNRGGQTGRGAACACPLVVASFDFHEARFDVSAAESTYYGSFPPYVGTIAFDRATGRSMVSSATGGTRLTISDRFVASGSPTGTPLTFDARLRSIAGEEKWRTSIRFSTLARRYRSGLAINRRC